MKNGLEITAEGIDNIHQCISSASNGLHARWCEINELE